MMFRFLLSISLLLFSLNVRATHLVGGSLRYEFLGIEPNGEYKYDIILDYYFNGDGSSSFPFSNPPPVQNMDIGIYVDPNFVTLGVTPFTPPGSAGDLVKYGSLDINLPWTAVSEFPYEPPSNCATGTNIIVYQVTYSTTITLSPVNPATGDTIYTGYHLIHERCCRNGGAGGIDNIQDPGGAGLSYYAYIPPFGTQNSSPNFTNKPTTFICANDTTTTLNTAIDIVKNTGNLSVPLEIRNAPTKLMKDLGYGKDYKYAHNFDLNFIAQEFMPKELENKTIYKPGNNSREQTQQSFLKQRWKDKYNY